MSTKKVTVSEAVKKADVSAVEDTRKELFRVDMEKDHAYTLDIGAKTVTEARKAAVEYLNSMPDSILPETLKKDS